jgi:hypothetical protein
MVVENIRKFVLITKSKLFDWIVMLFGMKNVINMFLKTMMEVFGAYMDSFLMVFIDYLNVHSLSWEEHLEHLRYVFMRFREVNFKLNLSKCEFAKSRLIFLGHVVS